MTTVRQIIEDAYREGGLIGAGEAPDSVQLDEGLRKLQTLVNSFFGLEIGQPLYSVSYGSVSSPSAKDRDIASLIDRAYVLPYMRVVVNTDTPKTLRLSPNPQDGERVGVIDVSGSFNTYPVTLDGNGRNIENSSSVVLDEDGANREWFYRADLASWVRIQDFDLGDQSPLPFKFDELLTTLLALRLATRFGTSVSPEISEAMRRMVKLFKATYSTTHTPPLDLAYTRLTSDLWVNNRYYEQGPEYFNYGEPTWWR